ncbi:hemopexin repeat-containing protein [Candidatus Nitrospira neomarina]|uniref:Hemopexin repeat-containing protein n=1 Tax=Candidatus Nitrospira neomarina TaxID=3020899 RepID=A0AA96GIF4_9BACT|nr:hemopexin repeat-containing protein [Candidatus Nitrospira neomarina]WNM62496.1 hemopexin repeat-containing protein [Candidatus Nitrospira neomarina]
MSESIDQAIFTIDNQYDPQDIIIQLAERGINVRLQLDDRTLVLYDIGGDVALPVGLRQIQDVESLANNKKSLLLDAWRFRQSKEFLESKRHVPEADLDWDDPRITGVTNDIPEPDFELVESAFFVPALVAHTAPSTHTSERMINRVAVSIIIVDGPGDLELDENDQKKIVAEVQEGLDWLADQEPSAKLTWVTTVQYATVDIEPWQGSRWPVPNETFNREIRAAFQRPSDNRIFMFSGSNYIRMSANGNLDYGYPKAISDNWKGMPANFNLGIDAALWRESNDKLYLFKGDEYVRFSGIDQKMDIGYPKKIKDNWPGMPTSFQEGIDAALMRKHNGKIYFFKGDEYVRFSNVSQGIDSGYPRKIEEGWQVPSSFGKDITAALYRITNDKIYFFKKGRVNGGRYIRRPGGRGDIDEGYPKPIGLNKNEAERLWRDKAFAQLGLPVDDIKEYAQQLRASHNTDWAFIAIFTSHPITWFAYAGTPRTTMRYAPKSNNSFNRVFSHETGHIFGAPDEYANSGCICGALKGRFFRAPNDNCSNCSGTTVSCIMKNNSQAICEYTPKHLGWGAFMRSIDAALYRKSNNKVYLFSGDEYIRFSNVGGLRDDGFPTLIKNNWKGLPASFNEGIDAAFWRESNGKIYFFKGAQYVRITNPADGPDFGYPKPIADNWPGLPASFNEGIDAAFWRESNGKIYFFKGAQYVRITNPADGPDFGYPKPIADNWPGLPTSFTSGIDTALMRFDSHQIYFFKAGRYVRYSNVSNGIDPTYPRWINLNWMPFPRLLGGSVIELG